MPTPMPSPALYAHQTPCHFDRSAKRGAEKPASLPIPLPGPQAFAFLTCHPRRESTSVFAIVVVSVVVVAFVFALAFLFVIPEGDLLLLLPLLVILTLSEAEGKNPRISRGKRSDPSAFAVASRYPKASALGLSNQPTKRGFSPWGMPFSPNLILRTTALALITATLLTNTACSPKPIPKTITSR